jgi:thioredoxin 1
MTAIDLSQTVHLDDTSFPTATAKGLCLVDFWAPWCGPCRMLGPIIDQLAVQTGSEVLVGKVNVDDSPATAQRFGVSSIPTLVLLKDGKLVDRRVGVQPAPALLAWIDAHR